MRLNVDSKSLKESGDRLFSQKQPVDRRNQELAEYFYPERADFTRDFVVGDEYGGDLMTGYPQLVRRDLGNAVGSMLRPREEEWFQIALEEGRTVDHDAQKWTQWATGLQRRAMYDPVTKFTRATKQADHDFALFGGPIISVEMNRRDVALLYRCWHPRDVAYTEDAFDDIGQVHRNWKPTARMLEEAFPRGSFHDSVKKAMDNEPHKEIACRHVIISTEEYDATGRHRTKWTSLHIDLENQKVIEESPSWSRVYVIPRWMTVSGSPYPYSPAAVIALPDARLLQAMTATLLEAGEMAVRPPLIGVSSAVRGDLDLRAGGFTAIDADYDERLGSVLRPLDQDTRALPFGLEMSDRMQAALTEAFYLNTIGLPPAGSADMTAYETGQRVQEYIRRAMPLFEPMEHDYNGALCELTFETLLRNGAFGPLDSIPESVGQEIKFRFQSPLSELIERKKGQQFLEAKAMVAEAVALDPSAAYMMDFETTLRDVMSGIGAPAKWMRSPEDVQGQREKEAQQQEAAAVLEQMRQGSEVARNLGVDAGSFGAAA